MPPVGRGKGKGGNGRGGKGRGGRGKGGTEERLNLDDYQAALDSVAATFSEMTDADANFDDALHAVVTTDRPGTREECADYCARVAAGRRR
jgi:hypothetical protein